MTGDPTSTQPLRATEHFALAERYATFTEYATFTSSIPQTAATTLDVARFHAFTGEVTFLTDPAVRLYLDGGSVYYAERAGDPAIAESLVDAGLIDSVQLKHGVVRVGDMDHLGRLFDRAPSVDRDAAMVFVEGLTEGLLHELANSVISAVIASAYRHHPSGIHRWFAAPIEATELRRPASGVAQIDRSVVEELPLLGDGDDRESLLTIDWTTPDPTPDGSGDLVDDHATVFDAGVDIDIQAELARFDADQADWAATFGGNNPDADEAISSPLGEFYIVWPDGTRERPKDLGGPAHVDRAADERRSAADPDTPSPRSKPHESGASNDTLSAPRAFPAPVGRAFDPLRVDQLPEPSGPVPDDVAVAVQRALRAIEGAPTLRSTSPDHATPVVMTESTMSSFPAPTGLEPTALPDSTSADTDSPGSAGRDAATSPIASAPLGFAPPTPDMRAEVLYERESSEASEDVVVEPIITVDDAPIAELPAPAAPESAHDEAARSSALRRLINSIRNKD